MGNQVLQQTLVFYLFLLNCDRAIHNIQAKYIFLIQIIIPIEIAYYDSIWSFYANQNFSFEERNTI